jgi:hypothetical protein
MKLPLAILALAPASQAYLSEGWKPGQPVTRYPTPSTTLNNPYPTAVSSSSESAHKPWSIQDLRNFSVESILVSKGVSQVLSHFGLNITERLQKAREGVIPRFATDVPLITDRNYEDLIFNEEFEFEEDEENRAWAILW